MPLFSVLTSKIFGGLSIALALFAALCWYQWGHWKSVAETWAGEANTVVIALREASGNDKVAWDTAAGQIVAMGESAKAKDAAIAIQNERIDDLARRAVQARARADELRRIADRAEAQKASALRRLSSMAATPGTRSDCMTLIREADEALNLVREAEAK